MDQPDSTQYLAEQVADALEDLPASQRKDAAKRSLAQLAARAVRTDAICDICHAAAVEEGKSLIVTGGGKPSLTDDPYLWESGT
jgi:hypothetical protein